MAIGRSCRSICNSNRLGRAFYRLGLRERTISIGIGIRIGAISDIGLRLGTFVLFTLVILCGQVVVASNEDAITTKITYKWHRRVFIFKIIAVRETLAKRGPFCKGWSWHNISERGPF